ncbi:MAG: DNA adenine methylase [Methanoculleus sp.]
MRVCDPRPFLKWAGGKGQLLGEFEARLPRAVREGRVSAYVEPFAGGGAVYFHITSKYAFDECHIFDTNEDLILAYTVVRNDVDDLIEVLRDMETTYLNLDAKKREEFYYTVRREYNKERSSIQLNNYSKAWVQRAADLIFLNRTCFNGLFRVNSEGSFNVPAGRYRNPKILHEELLRSDSELLENTGIHHGDFSSSAPFVDEETFVYFDPPYRPLNRSSSFTSYSKGGFGDDEQRRLAAFYRDLDARGAMLMLSNSDPKNQDPSDNFFDELYAGYCIERVPARRMINSNADRRGEINEVIITNYRPGITDRQVSLSVLDPGPLP